MEILLKYIGVVGAVVAGIVILGVVWLVFTLKKLAATPSRIHLREAPGAKWKNPEGVDEWRAQVVQYGFTDLGVLTVDEMPGIILNPFVQGEKGHVIVLYEHPSLGLWTDIVAMFADEGSLTVSSAKTGHELEHRPNHDKVYAAGETVDQLWARFQENPALSREPLVFDNSLERFIEIFEKAYAEETDWRNAKGGPSAEEIRRIADSAGIEVTDEMIELTHEKARRDAAEGLLFALKESLRSEKELSDSEWDKVEDRLVFVHDNLDEEWLKEMIARSEGNAARESVAAAYSHMSPREAFRHWNSKLKKPNSYYKLCELKAPVEADVYCVESDIN